MATTEKNAQQPTAATALRQARARDAELAMREYQAEKSAIHANTERLRALRLAQEAGKKAR